MRIRRVVAVAAVALLVAGCDEGTRVGRLGNRLRDELAALRTVLTGGRSPFAGGVRTPGPSPSPGGAPAELRRLPPALAVRAERRVSDPAQRARANAELLVEIYRTTLGREPADRAEFGSLADALNQGATLEGTYQGLVRTARFRALEEEGRARAPASPGLLAAFARELRRVAAGLDPVAYGPAAALPLARPVDPARPAPPAPATPPRRVLSLDPESAIREHFRGASLFTLKRTLAEEGLRAVEARAARPAELARWYGAWAAEMSRLGVDFGLPLRAHGASSFHEEWALSASDDRIKWEVLNRLLRALDAAAGPNPAPSGRPTP